MAKANSIHCILVVFNCNHNRGRIFFQRFKKTCFYSSTFFPCLINRICSGEKNRIPPIKRFPLKANVKVISDQFIIFDDNYVFHSVYKYMHVSKINVFTGVFHRAAGDRRFLVLKLVEIIYFLRYPFFSTRK